MTPRKVSLRVDHETACPNKGKTTLESTTKRAGCKCRPSYYTFQRTPDGKVRKGARVKDRRTAESLVSEAQVDLDRGRTGQARAKVTSLYAWLDEFEAITEKRVERGDIKPRTLEAYCETIAHVRKAIEDVPLRDLGAAELRAFDDRVSVSTAGPKTRAVRPASRLRHLRQFSAILSAAVDEGFLEANPVRAYTKRLTQAGVRPPRRGKAPFEDAELERLWAALANYEPVYLHACRFSAEAGLRLGELVALDWKNVSTDLSRVYVEFQWDEEEGLVAPKDREPRWVYLTPQAREVLEEWLRVVGEPEPSGPVFPNPLVPGGRLTKRIAQRRLATAMEDAGVPKEHPELRLPRSFHSLRYSTSVLMQRRGYHPRLIEATLGHSSLELTYGVYGGWTPEQLAAEAARVPEG